MKDCAKVEAELREMTCCRQKGKELTNAKMATLKEVYRILALCLGELLISLRGDIRIKTGNIKELANYTPKQFYKEITPADYSPFQLYHDHERSDREYYKTYEIQNYRNTIEGINWIYLNLPNEDIKEAARLPLKTTSRCMPPAM